MPPMMAAIALSCYQISGPPDRLQHHGAAIDGNGLAGDEAGLVGGEPEQGTGDVLGLQVALDRLPAGDDLDGAVVFVAEELARAFGQHRRGCDAVDADVVAAKLA